MYLDFSSDFSERKGVNWILKHYYAFDIELYCLSPCTQFHINMMINCYSQTMASKKWYEPQPMSSLHRMTLEEV